MVVLTKVERKAKIRAKLLSELKENEILTSYGHEHLMWSEFSHRQRFISLKNNRVDSLYGDNRYTWWYKECYARSKQVVLKVAGKLPN